MPNGWPQHTPKGKAKADYFKMAFVTTNTNTAATAPPPWPGPTAVMSDGLDIDDDFLGIEPDPEWDDEWEDDDDI